MKRSKGMVTIRCECGDEILVLPDLKEMGKAIDDHINLHIQNLKPHNCTAKDAERLREALIVQVLRIASKFGNEENQ